MYGFVTFVSSSSDGNKVFFLCVYCIRDGTIVGLVVSRFSCLVVMEMIFIRPNYACLV